MKLVIMFLADTLLRLDLTTPATPLHNAHPSGFFIWRIRMFFVYRLLAILSLCVLLPIFIGLCIACFIGGCFLTLTIKEYITDFFRWLFRIG